MDTSQTSDPNVRLAKFLEQLLMGVGDEFPNKKNLDQLTADADIDGSNAAQILSFLALLGLVDVDDDGYVTIVSKYPYLAMKAIAKRLELSSPITKHLREAESRRYFKNFTGNMELVRKVLHDEQEPIHRREMINLIIRGRQIRDWRQQDVYLHVFHPEWNEYHLVGLGMRGERDMEDLARKAMKLQLGLDLPQYEFESYRPSPTDFVAISESHGALSRYTIYTWVVRSIALNLNQHLVSYSGDNDRAFRWFTLQEVNQRRHEDARIMESTARVLRNTDLSRVPIVVSRVKPEARKPVFRMMVNSDIPNRIVIKSFLGHAVLAACILFLAFSGVSLLRLMDVHLPWLENFSNMFTIVGVIIGLLTAWLGIRQST